jgi:hypothetical protein
MAGRRNYYFRQKVTEAELDAGFTGLEAADRAFSVDNGITGIVSGGSVSQRSAGANISVDVAAGVAYDKLGQRIAWSGTQNVSVATDYLGTTTNVSSSGNTKVVSIFAKFKRSYSDPRTDGNSATVYFVEDESFEFVVKQGAESAGTPTPPSLDAEYILVCDVVRSYGQTQVLNANIVDHSTYAGALSKRREDAYVLTAGSYAVRVGQPEAATQALLTAINDHVVDTSAAHAATAVSYAGSGNWADGTAVTSTTVEAAIDEVVSDLAATGGATKVGFTTASTWKDATGISATSAGAAIAEIVTDLAGNAGAAKIGTAGTGAWADASSGIAAGTSVEGSLDGIVSGLAGSSGSTKVGFTSAAAWKDASTLAATTVGAAVAEIVTSLAANAGAAKIATAGTGAWADASSGVAAGTSVEGSLDGIVSTLAGSGGSTKVGFTTASTWADATGISASTVGAAIAEIVTDLAANAGAAKIATAGTGAWADASSGVSAGTSVEGALDAIVSTLAGTGGSTKVGFNSAAAWADASGISAATVGAAIAEIVTDIAATAGAARVGAAATGSFSAGTVRSQLDALDTGWAKLSRTNTFTATQTLNGTGADDVAVLATTSAPASTTAYQLIWELSTNISLKTRLYIAGSGTSGNVGLVITINCAWSAAGGVWVPDTTTSDAVKYLLTYNELSIYRKQATLPSTWSDASWSGSYQMSLGSIATTNTFVDGEWTGTASQDAYLSLGGQAAAGGAAAYGHASFRRKFAVAPTSLSTSTIASNNTSTVVTLSKATVNGVAAAKTSTASGSFFWTGTVTAAP